MKVTSIPAAAELGDASSVAATCLRGPARNDFTKLAIGANGDCVFGRVSQFLR
jgi:hypothetical protein